MQGNKDGVAQRGLSCSGKWAKEQSASSKVINHE